MMDAQRVQEEKNRGREVMKPYKWLRETFGKKTAEGLRERKRAQEKDRNPALDPKPYVMNHPDGIEDPEPWTLFIY